MNDAKKLGNAITSAGFEFTDIIESDGILAVVGFTSSPKQSGGIGSSKISGHSVPPGKSIVEKIRDDLDSLFDDPDLDFDPNRGKSGEFADVADDKFAEGIAHALGVLRSSSADHEWEEAVERYGRRVASRNESRNSKAV